MGVRVTNLSTGEYATKLNGGEWELDGRTGRLNSCLKVMGEGSPYIAEFMATGAKNFKRLMGYKLVNAQGQALNEEFELDISKLDEKLKRLKAMTGNQGNGGASASENKAAEKKRLADMAEESARKEAEEAARAEAARDAAYQQKMAGRRGLFS